MEEYGGYIELETFHGSEFHPNALALNSGRSCLEYLIHARGIKKLYLPYFLCDSVKGVCYKLGIPVEYYHIESSFCESFEECLDEKEYLYVVNYYGGLTNEKISDLKSAYRNIIVDNVQAFFQMPVDGIDTIYSCRKFFGVSDGAYLYTDAVWDGEIEQDYSYDRMRFLLGRFEAGASSFYSEYVANNKMFASEPLKYMSKLTHNLLRGIDYDKVMDCRTKNFTFLQERFAKINKLQLAVPVGGYMYPLYLDNGVEIRRKLQQKKIYIPILWPDVLSLCDESDLEYDMANNIFPLPIDQRYDVNDMEYIADEVSRLIKGGGKGRAGAERTWMN